MSTDAGQQQDISRVPKHLQPHVFRKGQSGNPSGRPKGIKSLKEYAKEMLAAMDEDERQEFLEGIDKKIIWEMAEGKPKSETDVTSGGEKITYVIAAEIADKNGITPKPEGGSEG